jgi:hypothetical protein
MSLSVADMTFGLYEAMLETTVENYGAQTAPAANTNIATVSLSPGYWEITAIARLGTGGVPAAADNDNMRIRDETAAANILTLPVIATQNSVPVPITIRRQFTATTSLVIEAVGAGTASVVYTAHLVCRKIADL